MKKEIGLEDVITTLDKAFNEKYGIRPSNVYAKLNDGAVEMSFELQLRPGTKDKKKKTKP